MHRKDVPQARIVLGGGISQDGALSKASLARIALAVALYRAQPLPLIVSGRWSLLLQTPPPRTEVAAMRDFALQAGIAPAQILTESDSMDTIGNAYYTYKQFIQPRGFRLVEVVTSSFHRPRAEYIFGKVWGSTCRVRMMSPPDPAETAPNLARLKTQEQNILQFTRSLLDAVPAGDGAGVRAILNMLPGYSQTPRYSLQELLKLIDSSTYTDS